MKSDKGRVRINDPRPMNWARDLLNLFLQLKRMCARENIPSGMPLNRALRWQPRSPLSIFANPR
jgi:hypothetical protein